MSWAVVARKDFQDARKSKTLWALAALFLLFTVGMAVLYAQIDALSEGATEVTSIGLLGFLAAPASLFVSIAGVVICYRSVAGESESGTGKLLLSLPNSRRDVVLGKLVGRTAVLAVPLAMGFVVSILVVLGLYESFDAVRYLVFVVVTLLFALAYVGLVVGISATTTSTGRASALAVGAWFLFEMLWGALTTGAIYVVSGFSFPTEQPDWGLFLNSLPPSSAYSNAATGFLGGSIGGEGPTPFFLESWFSVLVLVAWVVVPVGLGYLRYRSLDL